jgi:hypothetical protein
MVNLIRFWGRAKADYDAQVPDSLYCRPGPVYLADRYTLRALCRAHLPRCDLLRVYAMADCLGDQRHIHISWR